MCKDLVSQCGNCYMTRHVWWEWCPTHLENLKEAIQTLQEPLPHARDCPEKKPKVIQRIGLLACPNPVCIESPITKALRAQKDAHDRAVRLAALEHERREQAKRDAFARRWFRKRPIPIYVDDLPDEQLDQPEPSATVTEPTTAAVSVAETHSLDAVMEDEEEDEHERSDDWSEAIETDDEEHGGTDIESCHDDDDDDDEAVSECDDLARCPPLDLQVELPLERLHLNEPTRA